jgi:hypothetical protein
MALRPQVVLSQYVQIAVLSIGALSAGGFFETMLVLTMAMSKVSRICA